MHPLVTYLLISVAVQVVKAQCPRVQRPQYGRIRRCDNSIGGTCRMKCRQGYELVGDSVLVCNENGEWSAAPPLCVDRRVECGPVPSLPPEVALPTNCPNYLGSRCPVQCRVGYILVEEGYASCDVNGRQGNGRQAVWIVDPGQCIREENSGNTGGKCRKLRRPQNGYFVNRCRRNVGSRCMIGCVSPYRLMGANSRRCLPNGRWSGKQPECIVEEGCPSISNIEGGRMSGSCQPGIIGQSCQITCDPPYQLQGSSNIYCLSDGSWSESTPVCRSISCPSLGAPINGRQNGVCNPGQSNQICHFDCDEGFALMGDSDLTCRGDGRWSNNPPTCQAIECPSITSSEEGTVSGSCNPGVYGQICYFSCRSGYYLVGPTSILCQRNGLWSADPPNCERVSCPSLNVPANSIQTGTCFPGQAGEWCNVQCNNGFTLVGTSSLLCQVDGTWSNQFPTCQPAEPVGCPAIQPPINGRIGTCNTAVGGVCTILCNNGFKASGSTSIVCLATRQWSTSSAICTRARVVTRYRCPRVRRPQFGRIRKCDNSIGGICKIKCRQGYELLGTSILICRENGEWSAKPPLCLNRLVDCGSLPSLPSNVILPENCPHCLGTLCPMHCKSGFILEKEGYISCDLDLRSGDRRQAVWIMQPGQCRRIENKKISGKRCNALRRPKNGYFINKCSRRFGAHCVMGCVSPYKLVGANTRRCLPNGRWSRNQPKCVVERQCPAFPSIPGRRMSGSCQLGIPGEICQIFCETGYRLEGLSSIYCLRDGSWSGTAPVCHSISCPSLSAPENGRQSGKCSPGQPNQVCHFDCNEGFALNGKNDLICLEDRTWSHEVPTCHAIRCQSVIASEELFVSGSCDIGIHGQSCYFSCRSNYRLVGPTSIQCQKDGLWSADPPECERITCPSLNILPNSVQSGICSPGLAGEWCNFQCNNGFVLIGTKSILCEADGTWSNPLPICERDEPNECPAILQPRNGRITNCNNTVGGICTISCNNGYKAFGSTSIICLANHQWNASTTVCKRRNYIITHHNVPLWCSWLYRG